MAHHAARGHAFSAQYNAAVQDPFIAASKRTELVDLLIPQDDNQLELISLPTLGPPRKSMIPTGTLIEPSPEFVLNRFLMWTLIRTQLKLQHLR
jgi:hypothetical protein